MGFDEAHLNAQAEHVFEGIGDAGAELFECADAVAEGLSRNFHLHFHLIEAMHAGEDDPVVRQRALDVEQRRLPWTVTEGPSRSFHSAIWVSIARSRRWAGRA